MTCFSARRCLPYTLKEFQLIVYKLMNESKETSKRCSLSKIQFGKGKCETQVIWGFDGFWLVTVLSQSWWVHSASLWGSPFQLEPLLKRSLSKKSIYGYFKKYNLNLLLIVQLLLILTDNMGFYKVNLQFTNVGVK